MKTTAKRTIAIVLATIMVVAACFTFSASAEEVNYAKDASYEIYTVKDGEETLLNTKDGNYFGNTDDSTFTRLNDGVSGDAEAAETSVSPGINTGTVEYRFDLGAVKTGINTVILRTMENSFAVDTANNRSYDKDKFVVKTAGSDGTFTSATVAASEVAVGDNGFTYDVTLTFAAVDAQYVTVIAAPVDGTWLVVTTDEIEILNADGAVAPSQSAAPIASETAAPTASETAAPTASETAATPVVTEPAPADAKFALDVAVPAKVAAGEQFDVVVTVKNITAENGLQAVEFVLKYDSSLVTPVIALADGANNTEIYDAFMTTVPQYIMEVAGTEVSASRYEQIVYLDKANSAYECRFVDKLEANYAMKKSGQTFEAGVKADGELQFTIPFTVNAGVADGTAITFTVPNKGCAGTDPGAGADPKIVSVAGAGAVAVASVGTVAPSETTPSASETTPSVSETTPTTTAKNPTPATGSTGIAVFAILALISLAGVVVAKKVRG